MTAGRIVTKIYIFISLSWAYFKKKPEKNSGLTPGQNDGPDVKDDPNDPLTQFHL